MTLPYDYHRCPGYAGNPVCEGCRRKEPGREYWQSFFLPPNPIIECQWKIEPSRVRYSGDTTVRAQDDTTTQ